MQSPWHSGRCAHICFHITGESTCPQLFTGRIPFDHVIYDFHVIMEVMQGARPPRPIDAEAAGFDETIWGIMERCWHIEPGLRPSCQEVLDVVTSMRGCLEPIVSQNDVL